MRLLPFGGWHRGRQRWGRLTGAACPWKDRRTQTGAQGVRGREHAVGSEAVQMKCASLCQGSWPWALCLGVG